MNEVDKMLRERYPCMESEDLSPHNLKLKHLGEDNNPPPLPEWLQTRPPSSRLSPVVTQLEQQLLDITFTNIFTYVLEQLMECRSLSVILREDPRVLDYGKFLKWVMKDEERKMQYYEAQAVASEIMAGTLIDIADADDTIEDVHRSTLRINTRKYLMGIYNKKRFGETKQLEQNITIDIGAAMERAQDRVNNVIDITPGTQHVE